MKFFYIIVCVLSFNILLSQNNKHEVSILFDETNENMFVDEKIINDSISIKVFTITKEIPKEKFDYVLSFDKKGFLQKGLLGASSENNHKINLIYSSQKSINDTTTITGLNKNLIDNTLILNSQFISLKSLLNKAKKIFIYIKKTENQYSVYEVEII